MSESAASYRRPAPITARGIAPKSHMNGLETRYDSYLRLLAHAGKVLWYRFEGVTLRIGHDTRYTPDFAVLTDDLTLELHEVKGYMRDDARVKLAAAAQMYPFRFLLVRERPKRIGGGWDVQEVRP